MKSTPARPGSATVLPGLARPAKNPPAKAPTKNTACPTHSSSMSVSRAGTNASTNPPTIIVKLTNVQPTEKLRFLSVTSNLPGIVRMHIGPEDRLLRPRVPGPANVSDAPSGRLDARCRPGGADRGQLPGTAWHP